MSATAVFTDETFEADVLRSDLPVLVDFWGEGCGGCRAIAPAIDAVAELYAGKAKVGKLDVTSNGNTALRFSIRSIPTLLLFKGGKVVGQRVGVLGRPELETLLDAYV